METIISTLFGARDTAHKLHLASRSFAEHLALGDLYDALLESADSIAEQIQGKYGLMNLPTISDDVFKSESASTFIVELAKWAEESRTAFNSEDTHLLNEWDVVISVIYKAKYKIENLK